MKNKIEVSSGNVYEDLDLPDSTTMFLKAQLASKITDIIKDNHYTQNQAAEILGIPQSKLSGLMRGQFRGVSELKMMECLLRLGLDVEIVVREQSSEKKSSSLIPKVVFA
ncbi:helix-turn-helix domain-containing protein [Pectobacterium versatile]|uniref:helix-turn-helix domain-containing protein n=1 Tax=Pectobacterium versatile TaxID=2488639 RepID=UPI000C7F51AF|nr:helix-turn-helix transcriptional regulator [Pectobacterium versatile]PLY35735.1 transcriptional regulator [Pectobacterium carotovorum]